MSAMTRIPRVRQILVLTTLFALTAMPMAGARSLGAPGAAAGDSWVGAAVRVIERLFAPAPGARSSRPMTRKDDSTTNSPAGGGCMDPQGHPRPICL
jgi:hypothetical protein